VPDFVLIAGSSYEVVPVARPQHLGIACDCYVCHRTRRLYVSAAVSSDRLPALLSQARRDAEKLIRGLTAASA
jgi:hypothetical protein